MSTTPRFMASTANARAREREPQHRVLESVNNLPWAHGAAFVFRASPQALAEADVPHARKPGAHRAAKAPAHAKPGQPARQGAPPAGAYTPDTSPAKSSFTAAKHIAGDTDGKRRRCARPSPSPSRDGSMRERCAQQLEEIIALRRQLFALERRNEPAAALAAQLDTEAAELRLRVRAEQSRHLSPSTLVAQLAFSVLGSAAAGARRAVPAGRAPVADTDVEFTDGRLFDMDGEQEEAEDEHRWSIADSDAGAEPKEDAGVSWTPKARASGPGFHFL